MEALMEKKRTRRLYDREFKIQAVKTLERGEMSMTQLAKDLGININTLSGWKKQYQETVHYLN